MQRLVHLLLVILLFAGIGGVSPAAAQIEEGLDLANVPLPVQDLPESGFQIMAGGYLVSDELAGFIAGPRNLSSETVKARLDDVALTRAYVLDAALPEDRAWQDSPILALHQTTVYGTDDSSAEALADLLRDYSNIEFLDQSEPAIEGATTVYWIGESGDQIRTVVVVGDIVIEVVSLDTTGMPSAAEHAGVVEGTVNRLERVRSEEGVGLSSMALNLAPGEDLADFFNAQQSGVHGIYRLRDGAIQPAMGEIEADSFGVDPAITSMYFGHELVQSGGGTSSVSVALYSFGDADMAQMGYESLLANNPGSQLIDPYFTIGEGETWTDQGVNGVYRVTGNFRGTSYSGFVEIRVQDTYLAVVGHRSIGAALPDANVTSNLMDHQLECLQSGSICPPFEIVATPPPAPQQATPVVDNPTLGSNEFGWSLPTLGDDWIVDEQFSESGYDRLGLRNGLSIFELESVINHHGEPVQCVLDELNLLEEFEEHSYIRLWEDADGNNQGGATETQAWAVYRVEPLEDERADQEYVIRIDCFTLVEGSVNLVMRHIAPIDFWEDEASKGEFLRGAIRFPESQMRHGTLIAIAHERRSAMIYFHSIHHAA